MRTLATVVHLAVLLTVAAAVITEVSFEDPLVIADWIPYSVPPTLFQSQVTYGERVCLQIGINASYVYTKQKCETPTPDPTAPTNETTVSVAPICEEVPDPDAVCDVDHPLNCIQGRGLPIMEATFVAVDMIIPANWATFDRASTIYVELTSSDDANYWASTGIQFQESATEGSSVSYYDLVGGTWVPIDINITQDQWYTARFSFASSTLTIELAEGTSCVFSVEIDTTYEVEPSVMSAPASFSAFFLTAESFGESYEDVYFNSPVYGTLAEAPACGGNTMLADWEYAMIGVSSFIVLVAAILTICLKRDCMGTAKKLTAFLQKRSGSMELAKV